MSSIEDTQYLVFNDESRTHSSEANYFPIDCSAATTYWHPYILHLLPCSAIEGCLDIPQEDLNSEFEKKCLFFRDTQFAPRPDT